MASRGLGSLTLDLIAKIGGFTGPLSQAERAANKNLSNIEKRANAFGRSIGSSMRAAAGQFLAFAGVAVTVGSAMNAIKSAIDIADETRDLSIRLGESTETISEFRYAAQQTGTDMDALGKGMKILAKNAADALNPMSSQAKVFDALGIKVKDSEGKLKKLGELVPEIADKFKTLEDGTTKAALAQALFGKSGLDLTEFLNQGADGLQTMADKARELGIVIDQETADAADKFKDDLDDVKGALGGIALQIARELLPIMDDLALSFKDTATNGEEVSKISERIAAGLKVAGYIADQAGTFFNQLGEFLGAAAIAGEGFYGVLTGLATFDLSKIKSAAELVLQGSHGARDALFNNLPGDTKEVKRVKIQLITADSGSIPDSALRTSAGEAAAKAKADALEKRLAAALANPSGSKGSKKTGKSDAEREAEQVARAIEQMTKAQQGWQDELSKTGNPIADEYASRLREIAESGKEFTKDGVPADKVKVFTDEMTKLATTMRDTDIAKFQQEFNDETDEMAARMQGPAAEALQTYQEEVRKLDDLLKVGAITLDEYDTRLGQLGVVRDAPMTDVNEAIREQIMLLGMSSEQQEIYNNLKAAGVTAESAWGQTITENTKALQDMREQTDLIDDIKSGLSDVFVEFGHGAEAGKKAWDSFMDHLYSRALQFVADKAIQALFDGISGNGASASGTASSGTGWASLLAGLFGGGKAGGGSVTPGKFYEVGEGNRPEMFMSGNHQYMIPGNQGRVVPMGGGGGGITQYNTFKFAAPERPATQQQLAGRQAFELAQAQRRK